MYNTRSEGKTETQEGAVMLTTSAKQLDFFTLQATSGPSADRIFDSLKYRKDEDKIYCHFRATGVVPTFGETPLNGVQLDVVITGARPLDGSPRLDIKFDIVGNTAWTHGFGTYDEVTQEGSFVIVQQG